jgi:DnaJ domain
MGVNCFQVLGLIPPVSIAELKSAYRKAAALHHPDQGGSHQMMVQVNEAYERCKLLAKVHDAYERCNFYQPQDKPQPQDRHQPKPQPKTDSSHQIWTEYIDDLIFIQEMSDYKRAWLIFQLLDCEIKPPIEAWQYLAAKMGYRTGWAYFKFNEWEAYPDRQNSPK